MYEPKLCDKARAERYAIQLQLYEMYLFKPAKAFSKGVDSRTIVPTLFCRMRVRVVAIRRINRFIRLLERQEDVMCEPCCTVLPFRPRQPKGR